MLAVQITIWYVVSRKQKKKKKIPLNYFWLFLLSAISGKFSVFFVVFFFEGGLAGEEPKEFWDRLYVFSPFFGRPLHLVLLSGKICLNWRNGVSCKYCHAVRA